jgi:hypothetical protein
MIRSPATWPRTKDTQTPSIISSMFSARAALIVFKKSPSMKSSMNLAFWG